MIAHPLQLTRIYAFAVGNGLARSFSAEGVHTDTAAEWIHYCVKAAEEAFAAVMDDPPPARRSAAMDVLDELEDAMERADIGFAPPRKSEPATGA
ncbi:MAG TPA: hypothetical protein VFC39_19440, partial [Acidobacteriaceae bacterium]|nr:hypothetical protein [Acidobacteriaceae bacterium]